VRAIMAAQASRARRLAAADDVLDNGGDLHHLEIQVADLHRKYLRLSSQIAKANC
jgi:dephospho-CoA kinase